MQNVVISTAAELDIEAILYWAEKHFGRHARHRYEALLTQAIADLAENPTRTGSHDRPEVAPAARTYHLIHSRRQVPRAVGRVKKPRHFILFREGGGHLQVSRVLHDSMDLAEHVPEDFRD